MCMKRTKFEANCDGLKTSLARRQEESGVKYSPINQFIKGSISCLVMNSYLNDNLADKQCYFSLDSFSTKKTESNRFFVRAFGCLQRAFQNPSILVFETLSEKPRRTQFVFGL